MAGLTDLPNEMLEAIVQQIPQPRDRANFGRSCRRIWEVAKPEIYRSITIHTLKPKTVFSAFLAGCRHGDSIKELTIVVDPLMDSLVGAFEADPDSCQDDVLWQASASILTTIFQRTHFALPRLQTLNIKFPTEQFGLLFGSLGGGEPWEVKLWSLFTSQIEDLMTIVTSLSDATITDFTISNLPVYHSPPAFKTAAWQSFLHQVERFNLSIFGEDEGDFATSSELEFREFIEEIPTTFTNHLRNAKHLKIDSSTCAIFGHDRGLEFDNPLRLGSSAMLHLTSLEFTTIIIDQSFIDFLTDRPENCPPLDLKLTNVMCHHLDLPHLPQATNLKWHEIFSAMTELLDRPRSPVIRSLTASFLDVAGLPTVQDFSEVDASMAVRELKMFVASNPKLVVFPYIQLGEEYAQLLVDLETTKKALLAQNDLRQYSRLLSRIQEVNQAPKLVQDVLGRA